MVDSDDLPLNVSEKHCNKAISRKLVRKTIEMMKKLAETEDDEANEITRKEEGETFALYDFLERIRKEHQVGESLRIPCNRSKLGQKKKKNN